MKRIIGIFIVLLGLAIPSSATHLLGGEITWTCLTTGNDAGKFVFELRLYRQCGGAGLGGTATIQSSVGSISVSRTSQLDVSPKCEFAGLSPDCNDPNRDENAIEEHIYESQPMTITGTPPTGGWEFYWTSCCRPSGSANSPIMDNLSPNSQGYRLRAWMFPYTPPGGTTPLTVNTCYDSSPVFSSAPTTVICTGYPFTYNHNAKDAELDSLTYEWAPALVTSGASVTYATNTNTSQVTPRAFGGGFIVPSPGFSFSVPLPWAAPPNLNTNNVPASINIKTGEVDYTSFNQGHFATCVRVSAYRCQQKIAEIYRDIPVFLVSCPPLTGTPANVPPVITFKDSTGAFIPLPARDTVLAGQFVKFTIESTDFQFNYSPIRPQTNRLIPDGVQFGANFADPTSGCPYPPCAVMDTTINYDQTNGYWEANFGVSSVFTWETSCNHISEVADCFVKEGVYTFVFKVQDNYCPVPGANFITFTVVVLSPDPIEAPKITCAAVQDNGEVLIKWTQPVNAVTDTFGSFRKYVILRDDSLNGTYTDTIAVITDIDSLFVIDTGAHYENGNVWYYDIAGISTCNDKSIIFNSEKFSPMQLNVTTINSGGAAALSWNDITNGGPHPKSDGLYKIYEIFGTDTLLVNTTTDNLDTIQVTRCYPSNVSYYVEVDDTTMNWGCSSRSSIGSDIFGDNTNPDAIRLKNMTKDGTGNLVVSWSPAPEADVVNYHIVDQLNNIIATVAAPDSVFAIAPPVGDTGMANLRIYAEDSCGNNGATGPAHISTHLEIANVDKCGATKNITLSWNKYDWGTGFVSTSHQEVWVDTGTGYVKLDSLGSNAISYVDTSIQAPRTYNYQIRTYNMFSGEISVSNDVVQTIPNIIDGTIVDAPVVTCISVLPSGDIRIEWERPLNNPKNSLDSYHIWHSTDGFNYTQLDSMKGMFPSDNLVYDSLGYTHVGANGCATNHYYRIKSRSGCYADAYSDYSNTIRAICLDIDALNASVNDLDWKSPFPGTAPAGTGTDYEIYREYPIGSGFMNYRLTPLGGEGTRDTIVACSDSASYYITLNGNGCTSVSAIDTGIYQDIKAPVKQFLDTVSVVEDSIAAIGWQANPSDDVTGYYIVKQLPGGLFQIIDTIYAFEQLYYEDWTNPLSESSECYAVVAFDSCGNTLLQQADFNYHCNIRTKVVTDVCDKSTLVTWNGYKTFVTGIDVEYTVYVAVNGGSFNLLGSTKNENYRHEDVVSGNEYCYYVVCEEKDGEGPFTTTSTPVCEEVAFIEEPEIAYVKYVTVEDSGQIRMEMESDFGSDIGEYWITRTQDTTNGFSVIATLAAPDPWSPADQQLHYSDERVETNRNSYYYRVEVRDICGDSSIISNISRSILLNVDADNVRKKNTLTWNRYMGFSGGVQEYKIWRTTDNEVSTTKIVKTMTGAELASFGDVITWVDEEVDSDIDGVQGVYCYHVEAREGFGGNIPNVDPSSSLSNEGCVIQYPLMFVPTAFTPNDDDLNSVFKPEGVYINVKNYLMQIYDRWGSLIFETQTLSQGWDGTDGGREMPVGAYVYEITFTAADGTEYQQRGTITLTR